MDRNVLDSLAVTMDMTGTTFSELSMQWMVTELSKHPDESILYALDRCKRELKGRLALADILSRFPGGHPAHRPTQVVL